MELQQTHEPVKTGEARLETFYTDDTNCDNKEGIMEVGAGGFVADEETIPKNYWWTPSFIGSLLAIGFGFWSGASGFAYAAPILSIINADIGPNPNITWVALIHPVALSVGLTLVGRMADIFGRRYIQIAGALLALVGTIMSATAQSVPVLIGGATIIGVAGATQLAAFFLIAELMPMKHRFAAQGFNYMWQIPGIGFAPVIAQAFVSFYKIGWRGVFWLLTACNGASLILYILFYRPPTFRMKHGSEKVSKYLKQIDYLGLLLYTAGLALFLLGISFGGSFRPVSL